MKGEVAVVVPRHRSSLSDAARLSLAHLREYLGSYDRHYVLPETLEIDAGDFTVQRFEDRWFESIATYNRLLLHPGFYERFADYRYILIHQLDALVFKDRLSEWCAKGYDYVGAPWLPGFDAEPREGFWRVGNGGFSLRRVQAHIETLQATRDEFDRRVFLEALRDRNQDWRGWCSSLFQVAKTGSPTFDPRRFLSATDDPEDIFWSIWARAWNPDFDIAEPEQAVSFSFERAPRYCYRKNGEELPFGCHAWLRYDPKFWRPHLREDLVRTAPQR